VLESHGLLLLTAAYAGSGPESLTSEDLRERAGSGRYFLARTYYSVLATAG
jgi:hypothetical protein